MLLCYKVSFEPLHFFKTADVPGCAGKLSVEERPDQLNGKGWTHNARADAQRIGRVVFYRLMRGKGVVASGGADAPKLVGRDANAGAAAAEQNPAVGAFFGNGASHFFGIVGVIHGLGGVRAEIERFVAQFLDELQNCRFERKSSVVGCNRDRHEALW